jgi:methionyl-tRNA formyltransferase
LIMIDTSKTIVFFGTEEFSLITLKLLVESGYTIAAVVTKPDIKSGRGQRLNQPIVKQFALSKGIEVWQPEKVVSINERIVGLKQSVVGVLSSYGKIIPESTINLFSPGIINIHPSLLPKYRGPTPIESAIENGDITTGISIMKLSPDMDAGPIYAQFEYQLNGTETQISLAQALADFGSEKLLEVLPKILSESLPSNEQDSSKAVYCKLLTKNDAWFLPDQVTAKKAESLVRAHLDYPKTKIELNGHVIIITKAHISESQLSVLDIKCLDDKYLSIDELVAPSGRTISSSDFLNGYN